MCQYCTYRYHDGWTQLLAYDETYQSATDTADESTHGFRESWERLREDIGYGT
jgi:hypothetical protein